MQDENAIRTQIKIACTAKGYTRYQLAKVTGLSYNGLSRFLDGKVGVTFYMLNILCEVLDIPWHSLLVDVENTMQELSEEERSLIFSLRHLNTRMQTAVYNLVSSCDVTQQCQLANA